MPPDCGSASLLNPMLAWRCILLSDHRAAVANRRSLGRTSRLVSRRIEEIRVGIRRRLTPDMSLFRARRLRLRRRHKTGYGFRRAGLMPSSVSGCVTRTPFSPGGQLGQYPNSAAAERQWRSRVDRGQMIAGSNRSRSQQSHVHSRPSSVEASMDTQFWMITGSQSRRERCSSWQRSQRRDGPLDVLGLRSGERQRSSEPQTLAKSVTRTIQETVARCHQSISGDQRSGGPRATTACHIVCPRVQ
jgi:hypothetical protein